MVIGETGSAAASHTFPFIPVEMQWLQTHAVSSGGGLTVTKLTLGDWKASETQLALVPMDLEM